MPRKSRAGSSRLLTLARDLKRRKARDQASLFVAEGVRVVGELIHSATPLRGILLAKSAADRAAALADAAASRGADVDIVPDAGFASVASTETPQGVLAIAEIPERALATLAPDALTRTLVLDAVQDPGNVGTLIRTAAAFGVRTVVSLPGTAEAWNAKVVRSAAGGHFHLHVTRALIPELVEVLAAAGVPLWGADASGRVIGSVARPLALALALGNEGAGLSDAVRAAATQLVSLPMAAGIESLNVSVAGGILMHALFA